MTIYQIKEATKTTSPYFFDRASLKFFGQTMAAYKVYKQKDGRYMITAPIKDRDGKKYGQTIRYYNPTTQELDRA